MRFGVCMAVARLFVVSCIIFALAACASAPKGGASFAGAGALALCPGNVSNAPKTDSRGRIEGFDPYADVRGVMLSRAPVAACLSSGYGPRGGGAGQFHDGLDLYTREPAPVAAGGDGVVESVGRLNGYGETIVIRHKNGVSTRYAHLSSFASGVRKGARVRQGEIIGRTGRTGNATAVHLHYEVIVDGRTVNPLTVGR